MVFFIRATGSRTIIYAVMGEQAESRITTLPSALRVVRDSCSRQTEARIPSLSGDHLSPQVTFLVGGGALTVKPLVEVIMSSD